MEDVEDEEYGVSVVGVVGVVRKVSASSPERILPNPDT